MTISMDVCRAAKTPYLPLDCMELPGWVWVFMLVLIVLAHLPPEK